MKLFLRSAALTAAIALVAGPVAAQTSGPHIVQLNHFGGHAYNYNTGATTGTQVGPYNFSIIDLGTSSIDMFCDDYKNHVALGDTWSAYFTSLDQTNFETNGGVNYTRWGLLRGAQSVSDIRTQYLEAAWLSTQFGSTDPSQWYIVHAALWNVFTGHNNVPTSTFTSTALAQYNALLASAAANAARVSGGQWYVVTDVNTVNGNGVGGQQEFLVHLTPEPATLILLGTGLALTLGVGVLTKRIV